MESQNKGHDELEKWMKFSERMGGVEARVTGLERRIDDRLTSQAKELDELRRSLKESSGKLDEVIRLMHRGAGGWKALSVVGAASIGIFSVVSWAIEKFFIVG